jgi:WD40 repeat protein
VLPVAISPDGAWLATGSTDNTIRIWDTATGAHRTTLTGHTDLVTAVAISPDGLWLASAGNDATVRVWDAVTDTNTATMRVAGALTALAITPHLPTIIAAGAWVPYRFDLVLPRIL